MRVTVTTAPIAVQLAAKKRAAMLAAAEPVLAASNVLAPRSEGEPEHGIHLDETGFLKMEPGASVDRVRIGYEAFWALWQHENLHYKHAHGQAKFLETAMVAGFEEWLAGIAKGMRV